MPNLALPDDDAWLTTFGELPRTEEASGDEFVQEIVLRSSDAEELHITWDEMHCSVRVRHRKDGRIVADLFRELATRITVSDEGSGCQVLVEYGGVGWFGEAHIQVFPNVVIEDRLLRS